MPADTKAAAKPDWLLPGRAQRRVIALVTAGIALTYLIGVVFVTGLDEPLVQGDARSYFAYLPSIALDRDLDLTNQFGVLRPEGETSYPFGAGKNGYAANPFPVGPALLWLPGYLAGLAADRMAGSWGLDPGPAGYGLGATIGTVLFAIALAGLAAELSRHTASHFMDPGYALPATLLIWIGTPALYYTLISPLYSHAVAWFALALALRLGWRALREPQSRYLWLLAGMACGLLVAIRLQDLPLLLVPATMVWLSGETPAVRPRAAVAWLGGLALGYLPQAYAWYQIHGELIPRQNLGELGPFSWQRAATVLFSTGFEGWISWTPLVAAAIGGLALRATCSRSRSGRCLSGAALAAIAGMVVVDVMHPYGAGASYGGRRYVSATPLLVVGLGYLLAACGRRPTLRVPGIALIVGVALANLVLLLSYELMIVRHGVYPSLAEAWRHALGLRGG